MNRNIIKAFDSIHWKKRKRFWEEKDVFLFNGQGDYIKFLCDFDIELREYTYTFIHISPELTNCQVFPYGLDPLPTFYDEDPYLHYVQDYVNSL